MLLGLDKWHTFDKKNGIPEIYNGIPDRIPHLSNFLVKFQFTSILEELVTINKH